MMSSMRAPSYPLAANSFVATLRMRCLVSPEPLAARPLRPPFDLALLETALDDGALAEEGLAVAALLRAPRPPAAAVRPRVDVEEDVAFLIGFLFQLPGASRSRSERHGQRRLIAPLKGGWCAPARSFHRLQMLVPALI